MPPLKQIITKRFDAACTTYENISQVQKHSAEFLVKTLREIDSSFIPQTVLDLGTGTGYIPEILLQYYPQSHYTLNDIAPKMVAMAKNKFSAHNNIDFCVGDMENIVFKDYDLIISNLSLQWVNDLDAVIQKFYNKSRMFAFSCLLDGTFGEWDSILKSYGLTSTLKQYPKLGNLILLCEEANAGRFCFVAKNFQLTFANAYAFMQYLKNLGAGTGNATAPLRVLRALIANHDQPLTITYKIFFGIMQKQCEYL